MTKYRIMIVDDEADVREGIASHVNWDSMNMEVVAQAENGQDALDKAENCDVDIVLTDIKMPFLDGLEMSKRLLKLHPYAKIIILTGFDEFEYAQAAIRLNAAEYVLKPVNVIELTEVLQRVKESLDESIAQKRDLDSLRKSYEKTLPVLRSRFLSSLLTGCYEDKGLEAQLKNYEIKIREYKCFVSSVFEITGLSEDKPTVPRELLHLSVQAIIQECFENRCAYETIIESFGIVVVSGWESEHVNHIMSIVNDVCIECRRILNIEVTAGIGGFRYDIHHLHESFAEAKESLEYRIIVGGGGAIYINDMERLQPNSQAYDSRSEQLLLSAIKFGSPQHLTSLIGDMLDRTSSYDDWEQRVYAMSFLNSIYNIIKRYNLEGEESISRPLKDILGNPALWGTQEGVIKEISCQICHQISNCIRQKRETVAKLLINEAKKYIDEHYRENDLSVEKVCRNLHVSQSYFSTLFRKETGVSYVQYLTEVRMTNALMLLQETDHKTYMIAGMVGYDDPNYFSHVFKRRFGVSPIKYRKEIV